MTKVWKKQFLLKFVNILNCNTENILFHFHYAFPKFSNPDPNQQN